MKYKLRIPGLFKRLPEVKLAVAKRHFVDRDLALGFLLSSILWELTKISQGAPYNQRSR